MNKNIFIFVVLGIFAVISLISFIIGLARINKKKKEKQINEKVESLKKIKEDCANAELELINLQDQLNINKTELLRLQNEQAKEQVALQCARDLRQSEAEREKELIQQEVSSYGNYLWEKEKQKHKSRSDAYIENLKELTEAYDMVAEMHKADAEFARTEALEIIGSFQNTIEDYRAQCEAINEQRRQEELLENEKASHMLQLSSSEKEDIDRLLELSRTFNQKTVIYKLIWSAFLQKPFNDMINTLFGNSVPRSVIYCIENQKSHKKYVGKTYAEVSKRWAEHIKTSLNIGTVAKQKIHEALYGNWGDFTFTVLEQVDKDKLSEREKFYIDLYESNVYGYNLKKGG